MSARIFTLHQLLPHSCCSTPSGSSLQVVLGRREGAAKEVARRVWSPFWTLLPLSNCGPPLRFPRQRSIVARTKRKREAYRAHER
jgi:hypothetical protein